MSTAGFNDGGGIRSELRLRVYEAVAAVVSDDHNYERGVAEARPATECPQPISPKCGSST